MSELDKRVVEMQFDNAKFEKNVNQSMQTIDKLDEKLQFKNVSKSIEKVKLSFTAFQIVAISVIANITNRIVNLGIQFVKSLSVDNISSGWTKFGQKTMAVATMAAQRIRIAGKELTNYSEKMEAINTQLDKLNWFTDETSYNFTDMADNIGKFTAAGRDLDESVNAMMGIATWAALSGQNAITASVAMTQLSQALGRGYIMTMDWRSIENARMSTEEFKQTVLDTAVAMGEMTKEGQNYITKTGKKISVSNFELSTKWLTSDILLTSLGKYSAAVERIYEISQETGLTSTEVMARYSEEFDQFGLKAFRAAQEARTFTDTIRAIQDAVSTGWLNTFEKIFGGYDESKVFWTELANSLYDVFVEGGNFRNEILRIWGDLKGKLDIFGEHGSPNQGAFWNIYDAIISLKNLIKGTWNEIFAITSFTSYSDQVNDLGQTLKSITERIKEFTKKIKDTIENNFELKAILSGVFSVIKVGIILIQALVYALDPLVQMVKNIVSLLINRIAAFSMRLTKIEGTVAGIQYVAQKINEILSSIIEFINPVGILDSFLKFVAAIYDMLSDTHILEKAADAVRDFIDSFNSSGKSNIFTNISGGLSSIIEALGGNIKSSGNRLLDPLLEIIAGLGSFIRGILSILSPLVTIVGRVLNFLGIVLETLGNILSSIIGAFNRVDTSTVFKVLLIVLTIATPIILVFTVIYNLFYSVYSFLNPFAYLMEAISDTIARIGISLVMRQIVNLINSIGVTLLLLAVSMSIIGNIPEAGFYRAAVTLSAMTVMLGAFVIAIYNLSKKWKKISEVKAQLKSIVAMFQIVNLLRSFAILLISIAVVLNLVSATDSEKLGITLLAIISILAVFVGFIAAINKLSKKGFTYSKLDKVLHSLTLTLLAIAGSIKIISSIQVYDYGSVWSSVGAIASILYVFLEVISIIQVLSKGSKLNAAGIAAIFATLDMALLTIAGTLLIISSLGSYNYGAVWSSVGAIVVILYAFVGIIAILKVLTESKIGLIIVAAIAVIGLMATGLLSIAISVSIMAKSLQEMNKVKWESLGKFAVIFAILNLLSSLGTMGGLGAGVFGSALIVLSIGISSLAAALIIFEKVPWKGFDKACKILLGFIGIVTTLGLIAAPGMLLLTPGMIILSVGLTMLAGALSIFAKVPWTGFGKAMAVLVSLLTIFGIASLLGSQSLNIALTISLFYMLAGALIVLSVAFHVLNTVPWKAMGKGLVLVAGGFVLLGLIALILKPAILTILALSAAIALFGVGMILASIALTMFTAALPEFVQSIIDNAYLIGEALVSIGPYLATAFITALTSLLTQLDVLVPIFFDLATQILVGFAKVLSEGDLPLGTAIDDIIWFIIEKILMVAPNLINVVWQVGEELAKIIFDNIANMADELTPHIIDMLKALERSIPKLRNALSSFLDTLFKSIFGILGDLVETIVEGAVELITKVLNLLPKEIVKVASALASIILTLIATGISIAITMLGTLGKLFLSLVGGIILIIVHTFTGLADVLYEATRTILYNVFYVLYKILGNLPSDLLNLLGGALGALLGSIVKLMGNLINKYLGGLFGLGDVLYKAGETMANSADNGMSDAILNGSNVIDAINTAGNNIGTVIDSVTSMISEDVNSGVKEVTNTMQSGLDALATSASSDAEKVGEDISEGITTGIIDKNNNLYNAGANTAKSVINGFKDTAKIKSPSKVMEQMGNYFVEGLTNGINNKADKAKESVFSMMNDVLYGVQTILDSDLDNEVTIRPIMDLSGVSSGAASISSLMNNINGASIGVTGRMTSDLSRKINKTNSASENQNTSIINKEGDVYQATFNVVSDNPDEIAREVDARLQKMHFQSKQAKGGVR